MSQHVVTMGSGWMEVTKAYNPSVTIHLNKTPEAGQTVKYNVNLLHK